MSMLGRLFGGRPKAKALLGTGYEASRLGRRLKAWTAERRNINALLSAGGEQLRARARQLCRENPYAANACDSFVAAAVGTGIKPSSRITDPVLKKAVQAAWFRWTDEADADGLTDFYGIQALAARAMFEAGETFIRFRPRRPEDGLSVPLQLQVIEPELLPFNHNEDLGGGRMIRSGIQFDAIGRREAYHFLKRHPGDGAPWSGAGMVERTVVPASEVMHLYRPLRPGQIRGQPQVTPSMVRLYLLDQYDDAELDRKRVAAMFAGFITRQADDMAGDEIVPTEQTDGATAVASLEPGTMQVLLPGEDVTFSEPTEVGGSYEAFQYRTLMAISSGLGSPYHAVTSDVGKANYSSLRASQVEHRRRIEQLQHATFVFQLCRPVWTRWIQTVALANSVPGLDRALRRDPVGTVAADWLPPKWDWVDPLKDLQAEILAIGSGLKSRTQAVSERGYDVEQLDEEIAADKTREARLGLSFPPPAPAAAAPEPEDDDGSVVPLRGRGS